MNRPVEVKDEEMADYQSQGGNVERTSEAVAPDIPAMSFNESNIQAGCPQPPLYSAGGRVVYYSPNAHKPS
jgi:hypothetical protein